MTSGKKNFKTHCFITSTCVFIGSLERRSEAAKGFSETYSEGTQEGGVHAGNLMSHLSVLS